MDKVKKLTRSISKILWSDGQAQWAVTTFGVECNDGSEYAIPAKRLWEDDSGVWGWERHLCEKNWVDCNNVVETLGKGREIHSAKRP